MVENLIQEKKETEDNLEQCFQCGSFYVPPRCNECGMDLEILVKCPRKPLDDNRCMHTRRECGIKGFDYEACPTFWGSK